MYQGNATTYLSKTATDKFWPIDRIMFSMSPYITDAEAWQIVQEMEKMALSRYEGNFSQSDAFLWVAEQLGPERYQAVTTLWAIENQNAIRAVHTPGMLREAWMHKIAMTEGTEEQVRNHPGDYVSILVPRNEYQ